MGNYRRIGGILYECYFEGKADEAKLVVEELRASGQKVKTIKSKKGVGVFIAVDVDPRLKGEEEDFDDEDA